MDITRDSEISRGYVEDNVETRYDEHRSRGVTEVERKKGRKQSMVLIQFRIST